MDRLHELRDELAKQLLDRIKSGNATAADFNVARQYLKDNAVNEDLMNASSAAFINEPLPFPIDSSMDDENT